MLNVKLMVAAKLCACKPPLVLFLDLRWPEFCVSPLFAAPTSGHRRPPPQRAALRHSAQHHEGSQKARRRELRLRPPNRSRLTPNTGQKAGRLWRRPRAARDGHGGRRAAGAPGGQQGRVGRRARAEAQGRRLSLNSSLNN